MPTPILVIISPNPQPHRINLHPTLDRRPNPFSTRHSQPQSAVGIPAVRGEIAQAVPRAVEVGGRVGVRKAELVRQGGVVPFPQG